MLDTIPDVLNPNITSTIIYDSSARVASGTGEDVVQEDKQVEDESFVPLIIVSLPSSLSTPFEIHRKSTV
jgi:hypothetical protein